MVDDTKFQNRIAKTEADGETRYGKENWSSAINAIGRSVGPQGVPQDQMRAVIEGADGAGELYQAGRALLAQQIEARPGEKVDPDLEAQYSAMREKEREAHWKRKRGY